MDSRNAAVRSGGAAVAAAPCPENGTPVGGGGRRTHLALVAAALLLLAHLALEGLARVGVPLEAAAELEARDVAALRRAQDALGVLPNPKAVSRLS